MDVRRTNTPAVQPAAQGAPRKPTSPDPSAHASPAAPKPAPTRAVVNTQGHQTGRMLNTVA